MESPTILNTQVFRTYKFSKFNHDTFLLWLNKFSEVATAVISHPTCSSKPLSRLPSRGRLNFPSPWNGVWLWACLKAQNAAEMTLKPCQKEWCRYVMYLSLSLKTQPGNTTTMLWGRPDYTERAHGGILVESPSKILVSDGHQLPYVCKEQAKGKSRSDLSSHSSCCWLKPGWALPAKTCLNSGLWACEQSKFCPYFKPLSFGMVCYIVVDNWENHLIWWSWGLNEIEHRRFLVLYLKHSECELSVMCSWLWQLPQNSIFIYFYPYFV